MSGVKQDNLTTPQWNTIISPLFMLRIVHLLQESGALPLEFSDVKLSLTVKELKTDLRQIVRSLHFVDNCVLQL